MLISRAMLTCVQMVDGSVYHIEGAGDVCMSLPNGASYMLQHVCYVPGLSSQFHSCVMMDAGLYLMSIAFRCSVVC